MTLWHFYCAHIRIPVDADAAWLHAAEKSDSAGPANRAYAVTLGKLNARFS